MNEFLNEFVSEFLNSEFINVSQQLLVGFGENCYIFLITLLLALPLGLVVSMGSMTKFTPLRWFTRAFVWVIRGTPLMLQLFVVFYIPPLLTNGAFSFPRMNAALIAFVINYSAYFSEIYRGGIEAIPKGQYEAGQVLGMTKTQIFFKVVLAGNQKNYCTNRQRDYNSCKGYIACKRYCYTRNSNECKGFLYDRLDMADVLFGCVLPCVLWYFNIAVCLYREEAGLLQGLRGRLYVNVGS